MISHSFYLSKWCLTNNNNVFLWRRERDSNPRNSLRVDGLAIRCITTLPSLRLWGEYSRNTLRTTTQKK